MVSSLKYQRSQRESFSEVIIGMSRAIEPLMKGTLIVSLFMTTNYGNIKAFIIMDCYRYDLNFL